MHDSSLRLQLQHPFDLWCWAAASRTCSPLWQVAGVLARADGWVLIPGTSAQTLKCVMVPNQPFCLSQIASAPWPSVLLLLPPTYPAELPLLFLRASLHSPSSSSRQVDSWARNFAFCPLLLILLLLLKTGACKCVRSRTHQGCLESNFATWYSAGKEFQVWSKQVL